MSIAVARHTWSSGYSALLPAVMLSQGKMPVRPSRVIRYCAKTSKHIV